jgi:hypothetical protein
MRNILKNRLVVAALIFLLVDVIGGLLIMAPLLIFLRVHFEYSGSALKLWPVISPEVISDLLINQGQAVAMFLIAAIIIYIAYFPLKMLLSAGVYRIIVFGDSGSEGGIDSVRKFLAGAAVSWIGFVKIEIFGIVVYAVAIFMGIVIGGFLGSLISFLGPLAVLLLLLTASTYIQILKIAVVVKDDTSLKNSIRSTREGIAASLLRLLVGNVAVALAGFLAILILWYLLKWMRSYEWNIISAFVSILLQQGLVFSICLAQVVRINFNYSVMGKGE